MESDTGKTIKRKKEGLIFMSERFIVDTAGTLIDIETRNTYDYVSKVCPLLN